MSAIDTLTANTSFEDDLPIEDTYKSVSKTAVFALVFALLGLLAYLFVPMLALPLIGLLCGVLALRSIKAYPEEFTGKGIATMGAIACGLILFTAPIYHTYVYYTEVPEGYQRVEFSVLKSAYGQPDMPTEAAKSLNGQRVFVKGYILPNSVSSKTFSSFILVPDLATCCFGSQPPMTHMIQVNLTGDLLARWGLRKFKLAGTLNVDETVTPVNSVGGIYYTLTADYVK